MSTMTVNATPLRDRAWRALIWGVIALFLVNVGLLIVAVATNSIATRWLGTWLPEGYTLAWYASAWKEFQLDQVLFVTVVVVLSDTTAW